ncbi:large conductance mechanosensitive channel protein MscL [Rubripirellula amarantea]|uniref:Large-conductance mechanosensitive channel n=1 Tax=Rubripirellula amarantea TaxID=2527999 RepID=A0A5C5WJV2_9BACT|nr:large conductance mechanosensitive channel protein MscL [Rubripirellula amarantea]MDA8744420.1 large conductance mechanosensitive channel protein MscL [Rubripirellula amarantea]TWT50857.1 Large-conductance mechanosensitive channel [Rubripirellula amarantea]
MSFIQDFKDFAFKGNLIDMAVGIVMGTATAAIVKSFLENIISPLIAVVAGVPDMSALTIPLGKEITNDAGETVTAAIHYGSFIQNVIDFTILAFVIFIALKVASKWMKKAEADAPPPADIVLLTEIRDSLKK